MAEIKIAGKSALAPFVILGLAILALLIYLLFSYTTLQEKPVVRAGLSAPASISIHESNRKINDFATFVNGNANKSGLDDTYTANALLKLAEAINAVASESGYKVSADLNEVKDYTHKITSASFETTKPEEIGKATRIVTEALVEMQQARFPTLVAEAGELKKSLASINPDVPMPEQKGALKAFFSKAARLLQKMN